MDSIEWEQRQIWAHTRLLAYELCDNGRITLLLEIPLAMSCKVGALRLHRGAIPAHSWVSVRVSFSTPGEGAGAIGHIVARWSPPLLMLVRGVPRLPEEAGSSPQWLPSARHPQRKLEGRVSSGLLLKLSS